MWCYLTPITSDTDIFSASVQAHYWILLQILFWAQAVEGKKRKKKNKKQKKNLNKAVEFQCHMVGVLTMRH